MDETIKILVSGPVGAGKTSLIRTLSGGKVIDTDVRASENIGKSQTTVALDHGVLEVGPRKLHLFGLPGQDRFDFMWDVLIEGALAILMLVRGDAPSSIEQAQRQLGFLMERSPLPYLVAVTRQDLQGALRPEEVAGLIGLSRARVVGLNAHEPSSALDVIGRLMALIDEPM